MKVKDRKSIIKKTEGITLIALVITIIVLLILAGVTISALSSQNGILTRATQSKSENEKANIKDKINLIIGEWQIEKNTKGTTLEDFLVSQVPNKIDSCTKNDDDTFTIVTDGYEVKVDSQGNIIEDSIKKQDSKEEGGEIIQEVTPESLGKSSSDWVYDASTKTITEYIGADMKEITEIVIPNTLIINGKKEAVERVAPTANSTNLFKVRVVSDRTQTDLLITKITVSKGIKEISNYAFANLKTENLVLPEGLEIIGEGAISSCNENYLTVNFPTTLKRIEDYAFYNDKLNNDIILTNQLQYLGEFCFGYLSVKDPGIVLSINAEDKPGCNLIMRKINADAAYGYREIIIMADRIESQEDNIFFSVGMKLKKVKIKGLVQLPPNAFNTCEVLEEVELINSNQQQLKTIPNFAFADCGNLKKITLPDTIVEMGESVFSECVLLNNLVIKRNVMQIGENAFDYIGAMIDASERKIYCEAESKPSGWATNLWSTNAETRGYAPQMIWGYTGTEMTNSQ